MEEAPATQATDGGEEETKPAFGYRIGLAIGNPRIHKEPKTHQWLILETMETIPRIQKQYIQDPIEKKTGGSRCGVKGASALICRDNSIHHQFQKSAHIFSSILDSSSWSKLVLVSL